MPADPPSPSPAIRPSGYTAFGEPPLGCIGHVKLNAALSTPPSSAYELATIYSRGAGYETLDLVALGMVIIGPTTFTVDLLGDKVPFQLTVRVNDVSGGYPGVDTDTDYAMGPSVTSTSVTLTSDQSCTRMKIGRRI